MADVIALLPNTACALTFRVDGFALTESNVFNNASSSISAICNSGGCLIIESIAPDLFHNDLVLIESSLPEILAHLLIMVCNDGINRFSQLTVQLERDNPLQLNQSLGHKFYDYKVKKFLVSLYEEAGISLKIDYKNITQYLIENTKLLFDDIEVSATDVKGSMLSISSTIRIELYV